MHPFGNEMNEGVETVGASEPHPPEEACAECVEHIDPEAKRCPNCGNHPEKDGKRLMLLGTAAFIGLGFLLPPIAFLSVITIAAWFGFHFGSVPATESAF